MKSGLRRPRPELTRRPVAGRGPGPGIRNGLPGRSGEPDQEEKIITMVNPHETVTSTGLDNTHDGSEFRSSMQMSRASVLTQIQFRVGQPVIKRGPAHILDFDRRRALDLSQKKLFFFRSGKTQSQIFLCCSSEVNRTFERLLDEVVFGKVYKTFLKISLFIIIAGTWIPQLRTIGRSYQS